MPKKITIEIEESIKELDKILKDVKSTVVRKRIKVLQLVKKGKECYQSDIAKKVGFTEKTVRELLKTYSSSGILGITKIRSGGNRKSVVSKKAQTIIQEKLHNPSTTITSYVELASILENDYGEIINYATLYGFCRRNFKSKLKVSRKSHYKKDQEELESFKKNA